MRHLFAVFLILTLIIGTCVLPVSTNDTTENNDYVEIIIIDEVSVETKEKIKRYFATGEPTNDGDITTYGITCTLFGHNLENTAVETITHKVRTTSPRCLKKTYAYSACTRCDYETSELVKSSYIACC